MKKILVISGKGGTGKTVITASLACLAENKVMVDCDVDAANLYLLLHPDVKKSESFKGGNEAVINQRRCTQCGKCIPVCRFDAINAVYEKDKGKIAKVVIDPLSCEGCGACFYACPFSAIEVEEKENGKWFISDTSYGPFVFAKLGIASENSGKLVTKIKDEAQKLGDKQNVKYMIIDGPPGIGCPVISSLSGVDLALVVTEPSLSGINDMKRVIQVAKYFGIETKVVINKYDINLENSANIEEICSKEKIEIVGQIPFSEKVPKSVVNTIPYVEFSNNDMVSGIIKTIWDKVS